MAGRRGRDGFGVREVGGLQIDNDHVGPRGRLVDRLGNGVGGRAGKGSGGP